MIYYLTGVWGHDIGCGLIRSAGNGGVAGSLKIADLGAVVAFGGQECPLPARDTASKAFGGRQGRAVVEESRR
jgi:hypothetical protein